jgi:hypothetical protein
MERHNDEPLSFPPPTFNRRLQTPRQDRPLEHLSHNDTYSQSPAATSFKSPTKISDEQREQTTKEDISEERRRMVSIQDGSLLSYDFAILDV